MENKPVRALLPYYSGYDSTSNPTSDENQFPCKNSAFDQKNCPGNHFTQHLIDHDADSTNVCPSRYPP